MAVVQLELRPSARHVAPSHSALRPTTKHYDRARGNLDRYGVHFLTAYVAGV